MNTLDVDGHTNPINLLNSSTTPPPLVVGRVDVEQDVTLIGVLEEWLTLLSGMQQVVIMSHV